MSEAPYTPPPVPTENGFYWALLLWHFHERMQTIIEVRAGVLLALTLAPGETPEYRPVIPHDVIRWGPKLEFPEINASRSK